MEKNIKKLESEEEIIKEKLNKEIMCINRQMKEFCVYNNNEFKYLYQAEQRFHEAIAETLKIELKQKKRLFRKTKDKFEDLIENIEDKNNLKINNLKCKNDYYESKIFIFKNAIKKIIPKLGMECFVERGKSKYKRLKLLEIETNINSIKKNYEICNFIMCHKTENKNKNKSDDKKIEIKKMEICNNLRIFLCNDEKCSLINLEQKINKLKNNSQKIKSELPQINKTNEKIMNLKDNLSSLNKLNQKIIEMKIEHEKDNLKCNKKLCSEFEKDVNVYSKEDIEKKQLSQILTENNKLLSKKLKKKIEYYEKRISNINKLNI
jgi:hypothetical protein